MVNRGIDSASNAMLYSLFKKAQIIGTFASAIPNSCKVVSGSVFGWMTIPERKIVLLYEIGAY